MADARDETPERTPEQERARRRELRRRAALGGIAKAKKMRAARGQGEPLGWRFVAFFERVGMAAASWAAWRIVAKVIDGAELTADDLATFTRQTARSRPPLREGLRELALICGRRAGKSRFLAALAVWLATCCDFRALLAAGERGTVMVLAADKKQAGVIMRYVWGFVQSDPELRRLVVKRTQEVIEFGTGVAAEVHSASFRTVRGFTCVAAICDELSFWLNVETGANPDTEILQALRPSLATIPGGLLVLASTPYAAKGELHAMHARSHGRDDDSRALVWVSDSRSMNPTVDEREIAAAFERDPVAALSEWGVDGAVQFRSDIETFVAPEALAAVVVGGRFELPPVLPDVRYTAFVDAAGGSGGDSMTLSIAHAEADVAVLDAVRERRPPFSPAAVVQEFADTVKAYAVTAVTGDRFSGEFVRELFRKHGVEYRLADRTKSQYYGDVLPMINSGRVQLLDLPRLRAQLLALERYTSRSGRDSISHPTGGRDDVANAVAGALVLAATAEGGSGRMFFGSVFGPRFELDPEPPRVEWTRHCEREMRRGPREDREGEWLTCIMCGAARPLEPPANSGIDETRTWGEL